MNVPMFQWSFIYKDKAVGFTFGLLDCSLLILDLGEAVFCLIHKNGSQSGKTLTLRVCLTVSIDIFDYHSWRRVMLGECVPELVLLIIIFWGSVFKTGYLNISEGEEEELIMPTWVIMLWVLFIFLYYEFSMKLHMILKLLNQNKIAVFVFPELNWYFFWLMSLFTDRGPCLTPHSLSTISWIRGQVEEQGHTEICVWMTS